MLFQFEKINAHQTKKNQIPSQKFHFDISSGSDLFPKTVRVPYARCKINGLAIQQADSTRSNLLLIRHVIYIIRRCDGRVPNQMKRANASVYVRQVCVCSAPEMRRYTYI
jgi:hypothetical protein